MDPLQHAKILNKIIAFDKIASKKAGYSIYALALYCGALTRAQKYCDRGDDMRDALLNCFSGRLLDHCLKGAGLDPSTKAEAWVGGFRKLAPLDDD